MFRTIFDRTASQMVGTVIRSLVRAVHVVEHHRQRLCGDRFLDSSRDFAIPACNGSYAGKVLKMTPGTTTTVIEAIYHFNDPAHSFTALVHVEQTGLKAVIRGVVTEGWLKGSQVKGEYTQITTSQAPGDGTAYQGTIDIMGAK
jgi:hypothetical protein